MRSLPLAAILAAVDGSGAAQEAVQRGGGLPLHRWRERREPSVVELTETLTALRTEAIEALKHGGEYGRPYRQAMENIARIERRLEAAKEREERREREAKRDPRDIAKDVVDRQMGY